MGKKATGTGGGSERAGELRNPATKKTTAQIKNALLKAVSMDDVVQVMQDGLHAEVQHVDRAGNVYKSPDYPTRLRYIEFFRDTVEGTPVKRQEILTGTVPDAEMLERMVTRSPSLRERMRELANRPMPAATPGADQKAQGGPPSPAREGKQKSGDPETIDI